jgi:hypothetical protein
MVATMLAAVNQTPAGMVQHGQRFRGLVVSLCHAAKNMDAQGQRAVVAARCAIA